MTARPPVDLAALAELDDQIDAAVFGGPALFDMDDLIAQSGWSREGMTKLWLWAGLPTVDSTQRIYTQTDLDGLINLKRLMESQGLDETALSSLIRSLGSAMERLALWQVEAITQYLARTEGLSDTAARLRAAGFAPAEAQALLEQITLLWLRHYSAAVHRLTTEAILQRGVSGDDQQFPLLRAVGFAKIVDFTVHTAHFDVAEYASFVQDFHDRVADIVNMGGGRVIKNMGDSVLFVADAADLAVGIALRLAALDEVGFGAQVQAAVTWCRVLSVYGDIFGPGVNLAAKLAVATPPGQVFVDREAGALLSRCPRFELREQGEVEIRGLGAVRPIKVMRT